MTGDRHANERIAACLGASLALHIALAAWLVSAADASSNTAADLPEGLEAQQTRETVLGIDESNAVTLAWIGFRDPSPHAGPTAQVDQAQVAPAVGRAVTRTTQQAAASIAEAARAAREASAQAAEMLRRIADATRERAELAAREQAAAEAAEQARKAAQARQQAQAQAQAQADSQPARSPNAPEAPAVPDDREAFAASTQPMSYRLGRPVARQGLRIQTVTPIFDATTRLTDLRGLRRKPVLAIAFDRAGTVRTASFVPGTASGRSAVDEPILNAVHRWRATGPQLQALPADDPEATLEVTIRFDF